MPPKSQKGGAGTSRSVAVNKNASFKNSNAKHVTQATSMGKVKIPSTKRGDGANRRRKRDEVDADGDDEDNDGNRNDQNEVKSNSAALVEEESKGEPAPKRRRVEPSRVAQGASDGNSDENANRGPNNAGAGKRTDCPTVKPRELFHKPPKSLHPNITIAGDKSGRFMACVDFSDGSLEFFDLEHLEICKRASDPKSRKWRFYSSCVSHPILPMTIITSYVENLTNCLGVWSGTLNSKGEAVWTLTDGAVNVAGKGALSCLEFNHRGDTLAIGTTRGKDACLYTFPDLKPLKNLPLKGGVQSISWRSDDNAIVVGCGQNLVRVYNVTTGKPIADVGESTKKGPDTAIFIPDGSILAVSCGGSGMTLFQPTDAAGNAVLVTGNSTNIAKYIPVQKFQVGEVLGLNGTSNPNLALINTFSRGKSIALLWDTTSHTAVVKVPGLSGGAAYIDKSLSDKPSMIVGDLLDSDLSSEPNCSIFSVNIT